MTKRVQFLRTELYESEGRGKGPTFPAGSVWDMTDEFAHRWVTMRGVAVELDETPQDLAQGERFLPVRQAEPELGLEDGAEGAETTAPRRRRGAQQAASPES
jgi:hypothetical protein